MTVLGHTSASMSMVYARISDREVLKDDQAVLGPGAMIAGPCAEVLRAGALPASDVDWLRSNFFKTELELGHCLRLPQEGPCECDLYLTCAKFVTTPEYAPRLRERRTRELALVDDALARGWMREVERHRGIAARVGRNRAQRGIVGCDTVKQDTSLRRLTAKCPHKCRYCGAFGRAWRPRRSVECVRLGAALHAAL